MTRSRRPVVVLLASTVCSVTGNAMVEVLIPWLVLRQTGNAALAGLVGSLALVAVVGSLFFGAAIVDRWDRRNLSAGADILSALAVAAIPLLYRAGWLTTAAIVVLVVLGALFDGPGSSAREALRPTIANQARLSLERTNAFGEVTDGIGNVAGPAGAGLAVAALGLTQSFWIAAGLLLVAGAIFLVGMPPAPPVRLRTEARGQESYLAATRSGLARVWSDPVLRATSISASLIGFFLAPVVLVFTAAFETSNRSAALGGLLAAFALGSIGGAVGYAVASARVPRRMTLLVGFAGASIGLASMAALLDHYAYLLAAAVLTGGIAGPLGPVFSVIIQQRTDDAYRGRVVSTVWTLELITAPLSLAMAGVVIELTSAAVALSVIGAGCLAATIYTGTAPALRRIESVDLRQAT